VEDVVMETPPVLHPASESAKARHANLTALSLVGPGTAEGYREGCGKKSRKRMRGAIKLRRDRT
jgi:hypothetical protein